MSKILDGEILAIAGKSTKIFPLQNFVLYGNGDSYFNPQFLFNMHCKSTDIEKNEVLHNRIQNQGFKSLN